MIQNQIIRLYKLFILHMNISKYGMMYSLMYFANVQNMYWLVTNLLIEWLNVKYFIMQLANDSTSSSFFLHRRSHFMQSFVITSTCYHHPLKP